MLKRIIQKWLGIDKLHEKDDENTIPDAKLRRMIGEAFRSALRGGSDFRSWGWDTESKNMLLTTMDSRVSSVVEKFDIGTRVKDIVDKESFIDSIIDRIKRKQLNQ